MTWIGIIAISKIEGMNLQALAIVQRGVFLGELIIMKLYGYTRRKRNT